MTSAVVVVMPGGVVLVVGEEVDVPGPVDLVVEGKIPVVVVEEDPAAVVVVEERDDVVDEDVCDDVDDEVVRP